METQAGFKQDGQGRAPRRQHARTFRISPGTLGYGYIEAMANSTVLAVCDSPSDGVDAKALAYFMRATKAPGRGEMTAHLLAGEKLFKQIGCNVFHTDSVITARPGTVINGGHLQSRKRPAIKLFTRTATFWCII